MINSFAANDRHGILESIPGVQTALLGSLPSSQSFLVEGYNIILCL